MYSQYRFFFLISKKKYIYSFFFAQPNIEFLKSVINENNMAMFCLLLFTYQEFILGAIKEDFFPPSKVGN